MPAGLYFKSKKAVDVAGQPRDLPGADSREERWDRKAGGADGELFEEADDGVLSQASILRQYGRPKTLNRQAVAIFALRQNFHHVQP